MLMEGKKSSLIACFCLALLVALYNEKAQAQLPFSLDGGSDNDCYVQCPMECPQLNLDMVDCVVYCKLKCACPADDTECATKAMDKMQKAADEREPLIGPADEETEEEEAPESEAVDISQAGASDSDAAFAPESAALSPESEEAAAGDLAFAAEDGGEVALSPDALAPEIDTTSFVIEMDVSPSPSDGAPTSSQDAGAPEGAAATPLSSPQSSPAASPQSAAAPTPQGATAPTPQYAAASPAPQNSAAAPEPNAPAPAK